MAPANDATATGICPSASSGTAAPAAAALPVKASRARARSRSSATLARNGSTAYSLMIDAGSCILHASAAGNPRFTGTLFSMRLPIACLALCALLLAACGGSGDSGSASTVDAPAPQLSTPTIGSGPSLSSLLGLPESDQIDTPDVLVTSGTDYAPGKEMRVPI